MNLLTEEKTTGGKYNIHTSQSILWFSRNGNTFIENDVCFECIEDMLIYILLKSSTISIKLHSQNISCFLF